MQRMLDTRSLLIMLQKRCRVDWSNIACIDEVMERSFTNVVRRCLWNFRELPPFGHVDVVREPAYEERLKATGFRLSLPTQLNWRIVEVLLEMINQILIVTQPDSVLPFSVRTQRRYTRNIDVLRDLWFRIPHIWSDPVGDMMNHTDFYLPGEQKIVKLKHAWLNCDDELQLVETTFDLIHFKRYLRVQKPTKDLDVVVDVNKGTIKPWRPNILENIESTIKCPGGIHVSDHDAIRIHLGEDNRVESVMGATQAMFLLMTSDGGKRILGFYYVVGDACSPYPLFRHHMPSPEFTFGERKCMECKKNIRTDAPYFTMDANAKLYQCECSFPWTL